MVTKVNKTTKPSKVYAEWTRKLPLFDKKDYKDKTKPMHELLAANPIYSLVTEKLTITDKEVSKQPIILDRVLHVVPPSITSVSGKFEEGETFKVIGEFFGANPPKVSLEYSVTNNKGTTQYKQLKCKVLKKDDSGSTLLFKNAQGKANKSCMKIWDDDTVYTDTPKVVGYSEVTVEYPKIKTDKMTLTGYLVLDNKFGIVTTKMP